MLGRDLQGVTIQVHQLLHNHRVPSPGEKPHPAWLYDSLSEAIGQNNVEIVQHLLEQNVANGCFPAAEAVRARAFDILELCIRRNL